MLHNVEFKNFSPSPRLRELTEGLIGRLDRLSPNFDTDAIFLRLFMDENVARRLYHVTLSCAPPGRRLAATEERHDPEEAVRAAFADIERQFEKHKDMMTHSTKSKRLARREAQRRQRTGEVQTEEQEQKKAA